MSLDGILSGTLVNTTFNIASEADKMIDVLMSAISYASLEKAGIGIHAGPEWMLAWSSVYGAGEFNPATGRFQYQDKNGNWQNVDQKDCGVMAVSYVTSAPGAATTTYGWKIEINGKSFDPQSAAGTLIMDRVMSELSNLDSIAANSVATEQRIAKDINSKLS